MRVTAYGLLGNRDSGQLRDIATWVTDATLGREWIQEAISAKRITEQGRYIVVGEMEGSKPLVFSFVVVEEHVPTLTAYPLGASGGRT